MSKRKRMTDEELRAKIAKCPLWMQEIATAALDERDQMRAELESHYAEQKPSPFYTYEFDMKSGKHKQYIQADQITVEHEGIELEINIRENNTRDGKGIELRFRRVGGSVFSDIAIIPKHPGCIELRAPENLRP